MLKQLFNFYMVIRSCWIILLFQFIGYFALVVFEQGTDILRTLSLSEGGLIRQHSWASFVAVGWWSWQSWRSARVQIHFSTYDFAQFHRKYALRAQVLIPRVLGVVPSFIFAYGLYKATGWQNPLVYLYLCLGVWLYIFFHLRKDLVVYLHSIKAHHWIRIPEYILIKNEAYPAAFIWAKQGGWILFRLFCILLVFALILVDPVSFPQSIGSTAIVLFALGAWLVIGSFIAFAEKHYRYPFSFTILIMLIAFSFFNNNHEIRSIDSAVPERMDVSTHFMRWYEQQIEHYDTVPVIMVAAQGGGVRSSYWTAQVLSELQENNPGLDSSIYAYSTVSGGTLGVATYKRLMHKNVKDRPLRIHQILSKDFLSPVSSWLVVPDLFQKFLPFPVRQFDRAKALEYSWEDACRIEEGALLEGGFLEHFQSDRSLYLYHSTHAENGLTNLISNAQIDREVFHRKEDFFDVVQSDVPLSTAISVSSRFPFLTPPAMIRDQNGAIWGHLVDGGYVENMGASSMLELYKFLKDLSREKGLKTKFVLLFIKNTKEEYSQAIRSMHELVVPINTFSKVWINSGFYNEESFELNPLDSADQAVFISLDRRDDQLIPLGWFLSAKAIHNIEVQVQEQTDSAKLILQQSLKRNRKTGVALLP